MTLNSEIAEFWLNQLESGSTFMLYISAVNVKGVSPHVMIPVSTLKEAAKRTVPPVTNSDLFTNNIFGAVALGMGIGLLLTCIIITVVCLRIKRRSQRHTSAAVECETVNSSNGINNQLPDVETCPSDLKIANSKSAETKTQKNENSDELCSVDVVESVFYHRPISNIGHTDQTSFPKLYSSTYLKNCTDLPESCV